MSWLQALIIGVLYYLSDAPWFFGEGYYVLQRPIVAGFLTGLVMGDPVTGTIIGATINLIYLGHLNVGGSMPSDMVAYFQLSIVGVALFGLVFALIYMQMNKKEDATYGG